MHACQYVWGHQKKVHSTNLNNLLRQEVVVVLERGGPIHVGQRVLGQRQEVVVVPRVVHVVAQG